MVRVWLGVLLLGGVVGLCSCGGKHVTPALRSAQRFLSAVQAGNGALACSLLTESARSSVTGATDQSCANVITGLESRGGDAVHDAQVWGDTAQIRIGDNVLFLRQLKSGWRISAAGCRPRGHGRYDCDVQG